MRGDGSQSLGGDLGVDGGHVLHEVNDAAGVAPLVVVPGDELDEVGVKHDAGPSIEDAAAGVGLEVGGHEGLVAVAQDALHLALGLGLDDGADLLVGGLLPELAGEVDHGDVDGGDAEGHAGELALEGGDDLGHGLGGAGGGAAAAPVLAGGGVDHGLGGGHGVDGGHEGMMLPEAARPPRQSLREEESTTAWVAVMAWTVVMRDSWMSNSSWMALTMGARPLVVQDAQDTKFSLPSYSLALTPMTMVWESSLAGAE